MWALCCSTTDLVHSAVLNRAVGLAISAADRAGVHITFGQDDTRVDSRAGLIDIHGGHQAVGIYYACCRLRPLAIDTIIEVDRDIFFLRSHSDSRPVRRGWPLRPAVKVAEPVYACGADSTASVLDEAGSHSDPINRSKPWSAVTFEQAGFQTEVRSLTTAWLAGT